MFATLGKTRYATMQAGIALMLADHDRRRSCDIRDVGRDGGLSALHNAMLERRPDLCAAARFSP